MRRNKGSNHGTCWVMQAAQFAKYTGNREVLDFCRERYQTVLLPRQMDTDGSFPLELARTKPYSGTKDSRKTVGLPVGNLYDDGKSVVLFTGR